jgi:biotin transport system substrate-specific component
MQNLTYADLFRPGIKREALIYNILLIVGGSIFIALSAQIAIPVPFSPIPITGQTFAIILTGAFLGSRLGGLAVIAYLLEGAAGLPVFAQAHFGIVHLFGPTGGYLLGFVPAAFIVGYLAEHGWGKSFISSLIMMSLGTTVIFVVGLAWLSIALNTENILTLGFYPYLTGALIKILFAALIFNSGWKFFSSKIKK